MGERKAVEEYDEWTERMAERHGTGGHGKSLDVEARRLLPTPSTMGGGESRRGGDRSDEMLLPGVAEQLFPTPDAQMGGSGGRSGDPEKRRDRGRTVTINEVAQGLPSWGPYEPAIRRWEAVLGHAAPWATEPSPRSKKGRLSPRFVEWLMGWAEGWVTALPLSRNAQLKILGNGVVPQQAAAAVRFLLAPPPRREYRRPRRKALKRATPRGLMRAAREAD
jgi:DNA (cytosine-5)-methyltransferase 1